MMNPVYSANPLVKIATFPYDVPLSSLCDEKPGLTY
jgi:hypothetical protein